MDIVNQAEIVLRQAGYDTWPWSGGRVPVICFENLSLIGFLHAFPSAQSLCADWQDAQKVALTRFATGLRLSGSKAWNVYSVLLTEEAVPTLAKRIEQIEENFSLTRKIARAGIKSALELQAALLPLLPIMSRPTLEAADFDQRLRSRLHHLSNGAVTAFIGTGKARDVAEILEEGP
jgi:hypothetical protein